MLGPKVCVIIVNWNKKDYVLRLLEALRHIDYNNYDVVVVDNASTDGSAEAIREKFPEVLFIQNKENLGGTGGFNTGMRYALKKGEYKYIWLLDNDVMVEKNTLIELVKVMEVNEEIGIAGSAMYDLSQPEKLIEIGNFINLKKGVLWGNKRFALPEEIDRDFYYVDSVSGCSLCAKVDAILNVGLWDEYFFLYCDDVDWNIRFKEKGYRIAAVSKSRIWHLPWEFKISFDSIYYVNRNMIYLMNKHLTFPTKIFSLIYKEISIFWLSLNLLISKNYLDSFILLKAVIDFLDKKGSKCKNKKGFLQKAETWVNKNLYIYWVKMLFEISLKNLKLFLFLIKNTAKAKMTTIIRNFFNVLPGKSRIFLIKTINNIILSLNRKGRDV